MPKEKSETYDSLKGFFAIPIVSLIAASTAIPFFFENEMNEQNLQERCDVEKQKTSRAFQDNSYGIVRKKSEEGWYSSIMPEYEKRERTPEDRSDYKLTKLSAHFSISSKDLMPTHRYIDMPDIRDALNSKWLIPDCEFTVEKDFE